ncbi:MAG TPA: ABC transporter permease subunit [Gemmatimonadaceae bacterium]
MTEPRAAGTIYDLGYQPYIGKRFGRLYAIRSLFRFSFQAAFGVGRGEKAKSVPVLVIAAVFLPALVQIGIASSTGQDRYISYAGFLEFTAFLIALFAAAQAPELIITDKQHGVLSLYLSRPLKSTDYAIAKLLALTSAMLVITLGPQLLLFAGKVGVAEAPWTVLKSEWPKLFPIVGGSLVTAFFVASISLMLASFASRRGYGSAAVIVFFLLTPVLVTIFRTVTTGDLRRYAVLAHPVFLILGFANWLFEIEARRRSVVGRADLPGTLYLYVLLVACITCTAVFLRRYRKIEA